MLYTACSRYRPTRTQAWPRSKWKDSDLWYPKPLCWTDVAEWWREANPGGKLTFTVNVFTVGFIHHYVRVIRSVIYGHPCLPISTSFPLLISQFYFTCHIFGVLHDLQAQSLVTCGTGPSDHPSPSILPFIFIHSSVCLSILPTSYFT